MGGAKGFRVPHHAVDDEVVERGWGFRGVDSARKEDCTYLGLRLHALPCDGEDLHLTGREGDFFLRSHA